MVGLWGGGARSSHLPTPCSAVSPGILGSAQGSLWGGGSIFISVETRETWL